MTIRKGIWVLVLPLLITPAVLLSGQELPPEPSNPAARPGPVPISGFLRDGQPLEIHNVGCHITRSNYLSCRAVIENTSDLGVTALGFRWEQTSGDHVQILASTENTLDWTIPAEKARGRVQHGQDFILRDKFTPANGLTLVHIHVLFVELEDGTLPGGIEDEFYDLYQRVLDRRVKAKGN